jgi:glycosyltransferase involved in cell wall biosynthesis
MATEWVKRGYNVTVLTGIPNYPMGKFYPGYSWSKKRTEEWNGVKIIRIPLIARGNTSLGMVLNYYSFVISGWFWNRFNKVNADLVFSFETSPMTQVKVGCGYAKKHKVPHFLYVQDLWPENVETVTGIHNRLIIGPIDRMVDKIYKQTDKIFVTSPSFVEAVVNRKNSVDRNKVYYWPQYAEEFYKPVDKHVYDGIPDDDTFKVVFTGNIGTAQGLDILPKTAKIMKDDNVRFVIVGDGRYQSEFERHIDEYGVRDKFILLPRVQSTLVPDILAACDVGFISFNKTPLWEMTIPAKLQSYMACGMPIIASASGETKRIIEEAQCGICSEIGNPVSLSEGIRKIMSLDLCKLGHNAREYFDSNFVKKSLMDEMDQYFIQEIGNK